MSPGEAIDRVMSGLTVQHPVTIDDTVALRGAVLALVPDSSVEVYCRGQELVIKADRAGRTYQIQESK